MKAAPLSFAIAATLSLPLVACSGTSPSVPSSIVSTGVTADRSPISPATYAGLKALYVTSDYPSCNGNSVAIFKGKAYKQGGSITNGLDCPWGVALDANGNVYIANSQGGSNCNDPTVEEYAPGASTPEFSYAGGACLGVSQVGLLAVTTDLHGNVYAGTIANSESSSGPLVVKWSQMGTGGPKLVAQLCCVRQSSAVFGIAVDKKDDVFADSFPSGNVVECVAAGSSCQLTVLPLDFAEPEGLALDKSGNLLVADPGADVVDVVAPPYVSVTRTIGSGYSRPVSVTLNKANTLAFVADPSAGEVFVVNYRTGANVTTIPISGAVSAVDGPDAVY